MKTKFTICLLVATLLTIPFYNGRADDVNVTGKVTKDVYNGDNVYVKDYGELTLTGASPLISGSTVHLETANAWVIFENIRPDVVYNTYLNYIYIGTGTTKAQVGTNCRLEVYQNGAVVIPDANTVKPLTVYDDQNYGGNSATYAVYSSGTTPVIHTSLGAMNNKIRSFKLKRGYMVTFATQTTGLGYSRVYIADDADLEVPLIDKYLDRSVAFIRVTKWKYVSKKGWAGAGLSDAQKLQFTWCYDWGSSNGNWGTTGSSGFYLNAEYVPMRHYLYWDSFANMSSRPNSTSALGFNEPENSSDHGTQYPEHPSMSVADAIELWPNLLASGLRLGSPATTDGNWSSWLYPFIDECDKLNYRVDFIAVHYYRGGKTADQLYSELKAIHDRTGRPIWLTEWNNGANWTSESWGLSDPDGADIAAAETKQKNTMKSMFDKLNTTPWVERWAVYNNVQDRRNFIRQNNELTGNAGTLTPAGEMMRDYKAAMAFSHSAEFTPVAWKFKAPVIASGALNAAKTTFSIRFNKNPNGDGTCAGLLVEKKVGTGSYVQIDSLTSTPATKTYTIDPNENVVSYRTRYYTTTDEYTAYSNEVNYRLGYTTVNADIQIGQWSVLNTDWTDVAFGKAFQKPPVAIFGLPTVTSSALITLRSTVSAADKMTFRMFPWNYNTATFSGETVPYLILDQGEYNWGGLEALADTTSANGTWTMVDFGKTFESVPAVFAMQASDNSSTATALRIRNVSTTGFEIMVQKESAQTYTVPTEKISYLAVTYGTGVINGQRITVGKTADNAVGIAKNSPVSVYFGSPAVTNPILFASMQTANDTYGAILRQTSIGTLTGAFFKQTEQSTTKTAQKETAAWMVIDLPAQTGIAPIATAQDQLQVIAGRGVVDLRAEQPVKVNIYSLTGQLQTSVLVNKSATVALTPGVYIVNKKKIIVK